jgi:Ca2+/H+ antiporter
VSRAARRAAVDIVVCVALGAFLAVVLFVVPAVAADGTDREWHPFPGVEWAIGFGVLAAVLFVAAVVVTCWEARRGR